MAVRAHDLALGNLIQNLRPGTVANTRFDVERLVTEVVELQDERIRLAAVDAASLAEEYEEIFRTLVHESLFTLRRVYRVAIPLRLVAGVL